MPHVQAHRRLVKSPPELWNELSDAEALARHLGEFGEIRITRLEPETKVVWEGEHAAGTVELDSAGWGTQVTFTVEVAASEPEPEPEPRVLAPVSVAAQRRGLFARLFNRDDRVETVLEQARETVEEEPEEVDETPAPEPPAPEPESEPEPAPEPEPAATGNELEILENVLDALGQAHHRPFSRA